MITDIERLQDKLNKIKQAYESSFGGLSIVTMTFDDVGDITLNHKHYVLFPGGRRLSKDDSFDFESVEQFIAWVQE